ncbi:ABC transporter permease [Aureimonas fodinaquatilis]|uniref:ABC transporter permease n=1 Tax=Aureimonas fodinaquatilis TaxID=2565783 RepID=A0A5B0DWR7_9HYPH|nr:ABC transporter permease [Aureimonas fodinaquatilis]KAA0970913.1 ABC transporter permease [Aureimonas fodinaquatilis]
MTRLTFGSVLLALIAALAVLSFFWTPVSEPLRMNIAMRLTPPSSIAILGTDQLGRDVASLVMLGAGNSLFVAVLATALGAFAGIVAGLYSAASSGVVQACLMRCLDVLFAFPPLLSAMMLALALGFGRVNAILAIALFIIPVFARLTRASARTALASDYARAARALGASQRQIMTRHVLPNIIGLLSVQVSIQFGLAILTEAGLGFLGFGAAPPAPSWGRMLAESQTYLLSAPWLALAPGLAIATTVLAANLFGDGLRRKLDPRKS